MLIAAVVRRAVSHCQYVCACVRACVCVCVYPQIAAGAAVEAAQGNEEGFLQNEAALVALFAETTSIRTTSRISIDNCTFVNNYADFHSAVQVCQDAMS